MRPQLTNRVMSSFLMWMDNTISKKGEAYSNVSGLFYKISPTYNNYYSYGLPFKQIIADRSIPGANIMSGIYINNNFITTGQSGLAAINYNEGHVYFTQNVDSHTLSGRYAVKDFNVYLTNEPEYKLLFETKFDIRPKTTKLVTGLAPQTMTYPAIFLQNDGSYNEPFAFGGTDTTKFNIRAIIISDSQFSLDAVSSILRDKVRTFVPLITESEMPFNSFGNPNNNYYNYDDYGPDVNDLFINEVSTSNLSLKSVVLNEIRSLNPGIYPSLIDFELCLVRQPRLE